MKIEELLEEYHNNEYEYLVEPKNIETLCEEIERLNNIINELEKWLKEDTEKYMMTMETGRAFNMFDILDKIKELKGSDKK